eukprot:TRINITY_DN74870_c0_g1_i1.p1 TRINITY_DN74870_c0_g1~~TRINITY_DN74870_c0_g1_i1.p1  ORF type:complete len:540 (-),score=136.02 TRINITY_DN74870_c0_g1_i1:83-1627(-)
MVVLSVAVVSSGKTLIARQFVEMTRIRVEGLLSAFPKLLDSGKDHTFIETETVRYVYQPMESTFLVVVTNKSSNILEDLETLRLLAKVVQDCCQLPVSEELVLKHAFDIVFAFDEVVSFGYRESVTLSQIKTYTEMDSHEEKLHQMIEQSKMNEAKEIAKKKQYELAKQRAAAKDDGPKMEGIGSGSFNQDSSPTSSVVNNSMQQESQPAAPWSASMNENSGPTIKPSAPKKGMALGKKKPADIFAGLDPVPAQGAADAPTETAPAPVPVNPLLEPVKVEIEDKITAELQVEGGLEGDATCNGQFQVTVLDAAKADLVCFKLAPQDQSFKYKTHPNLNKASHSNNILEAKDPARAYQANIPAPLVKWHKKCGDESFLPVTLSCWPTSTSDGTQIVLELELTDNVPLENICIRFSAPASARPQISSAEPGEAGYDSGTGEVVWRIPTLDANDRSGTLEFSASTDSASLLPYTFEAIRRGYSKCPMEITECYHQARKDPIDFLCVKTCIYSFKCGV